MPDRCIVAGCDNINDIPNGIVVHKFPFLNDDRPEAKKRRKQWTRFVRVKRGKDKNGKEWVPTSNSGICSVHFRPEDFQRRFSVLPGMDPVIPRLVRDNIGTTAIPTIHATSTGGREKPPSQSQTKQAKKKVCINLE